MNSDEDLIRAGQSGPAVNGSIGQWFRRLKLATVGGSAVKGTAVWDGGE